MYHPAPPRRALRLVLAHGSFPIDGVGTEGGGGAGSPVLAGRARAPGSDGRAATDPLSVGRTRDACHCASPRRFGLFSHMGLFPVGLERGGGGRGG